MDANNVGDLENQVTRMALIARSVLGGTLMGLANLVPGISGGTLLLASGVYPYFIQAIAEVTRFKFKARSILVLGVVSGCAGVAILLLAGVIKNLVLDHRWIMYSIFIGLTFGGLPIVWKMARPAKASTWGGAVAGFLGMAAIALLQAGHGSEAGGETSGVVMLFVAGLVGAGAMILPGISGGYLLLVMGQYVPILAAIEQFKDALRARVFGDVFSVGVSVLLPVGVGVLVGIVGVSNLLKLLLRKFEKATLGVLLGLLVGAVAGLWPFQEGVKPVAGDVIKGRVVTEASIAEIKPKDYPIRLFAPSGTQMAGSIGFILAGFFITGAVARVGAKGEKSQ